MELWEILVPVNGNDGQSFGITDHQDWDDKVRKIARGLTILGKAKGQWICPRGKLYSEHMIPVRISCTREQIDQIADLTAEHYSQQAVMFYRVSDQVVIKHYS